jgi:hypothetical protein
MQTWDHHLNEFFIFKYQVNLIGEKSQFEINSSNFNEYEDKLMVGRKCLILKLNLIGRFFNTI